MFYSLHDDASGNHVRGFAGTVLVLAQVDDALARTLGKHPFLFSQEQNQSHRVPLNSGLGRLVEMLLRWR